MTLTSQAAAPTVRTTSVAVDPIDPIGLYQAAVSHGLEACLWLRPSQGQGLVGIGRAWSIEPDGPDRMTSADAAWRELAASLVGDDLPGLAGPVLVGGLGFDGRTPAEGDIWAPFGAASLVLPQLALATESGTTTLTTAMCLEHDADRAALNTWGRLCAAAASPRSPLLPGALEILAHHPTEDAWRKAVGVIAGAVGRGRLDKVVVARRLDVRAQVPLDVPGALTRLVASAPESAIFAFSRDGATFLGATPERLVRTLGHAFQTMAVAGSTGRGDGDAEDAALSRALLASNKDHEEHAVVIDAMRARLAPIAERLSVAATPRVLPLRHVQHLVTDIEGSVRERATPLALAALLHPTPAVAGEPTELALGFIAEVEDFSRGWYSGPIGWLSADGDGELMVALRCGVIRGREASLFAGCGIVADSDPATEWQESRIKLRTMAEALGAPGDSL